MLHFAIPNPLNHVREIYQAVRVEAEPSDPLARAGYERILIVLRRSIRQPSDPVHKRLEYAVYLSDAELAEDEPSQIAGFTGSDQHSATEIGRTVANHWLAHFQHPTPRRAAP